LASAERLPDEEDTLVAVPPVGRAWVRRVEGANLWLYFTFNDTSLQLRVLTSTPPIPLED
jgi:hypothetical protein